MERNRPFYWPRCHQLLTDFIFQTTLKVDVTSYPSVGMKKVGEFTDHDRARLKLLKAAGLHFQMKTVCFWLRKIPFCPFHTTIKYRANEV